MKTFLTLVILLKVQPLPTDPRRHMRENISPTNSKVSSPSLPFKMAPASIGFIFLSSARERS